MTRVWVSGWWGRWGGGWRNNDEKRKTGKWKNLSSYQKLFPSSHLYVSCMQGQPFFGVLMDTYGVGYMALEEAGPVGSMTVVDSPGQEVLNQLDVKASSETTSVEASIEMPLSTPFPGYDDSLDESRLLPEQESLSRLQQEGMSLDLSAF